MNNMPKKRTHGAAMVEFVIVVPIMVLLVFGITELGRALFQWNTLTKSVATGARYMARVNGLYTNTTNCTVNQTTWDSYEDDAMNLIIYGQQTMGAPEDELLPGLRVTKLEDELRTYTFGSACVIIVEAEADFESIFGGSSLPSLYGLWAGSDETITLRARTEERYLGE
jgi:hypothetical protein